MKVEKVKFDSLLGKLLSPARGEAVKICPPVANLPSRLKPDEFADVWKAAEAHKKDWIPVQFDTLEEAMHLVNVARANLKVTVRRHQKTVYVKWPDWKD